MPGIRGSSAFSAFIVRSSFCSKGAREAGEMAVLCVLSGASGRAVRVRLLGIG